MLFIETYPLCLVFTMIGQMIKRAVQPSIQVDFNI